MFTSVFSECNTFPCGTENGIKSKKNVQGLAKRLYVHVS